MLTGMRVLVVDDNPINRMIFRKQLEAWGMVVETSDSAVSASARMLAPASDAPIEILLLDEMMPDVSGSDFAQQLRLNERWADLPIILATSAGEFLSTEASQRLFTRRLTKPVRQSSLFDTLIGVATERLPARDYSVAVAQREPVDAGWNPANPALDTSEFFVAGAVAERNARSSKSQSIDDDNAVATYSARADQHEGEDVSVTLDDNPFSPVPAQTIAAEPDTAVEPASIAPPITSGVADRAGGVKVAAPAGTGAASPSSAKGNKLLLAEDNNVNQLLAKTILVKAGYDVSVVDNGRFAVDAVQAEVYDLVLMDIQMPEMDGVTATKTIRSLGTDRALIPILALTANAMKGDRQSYLAAGMNGYISKPIDKAKLLAAVGDAIANKGAGDGGNLNAA